jgi:hypothetical protein
MGKRRIMYGSVRSVSHRPNISDCQVGCFIRMILEPSRRTTCLASISVQERHAPKKVRIMKPIYVPLVTAAFSPSRLSKFRASWI